MLKNFKVVDFVSEEMLCFIVIIVFDGIFIVEVCNDGYGGLIFFCVFNGKMMLLVQVEVFVKGLLFVLFDLGQEGEDFYYIDMMFDFLVDELVDVMYVECKV